MVLCGELFVKKQFVIINEYNKIKKIQLHCPHMECKLEYTQNILIAIVQLYF